MHPATMNGLWAFQCTYTGRVRVQSSSSILKFCLVYRLLHVFAFVDWASYEEVIVKIYLVIISERFK